MSRRPLNPTFASLRCGWNSKTNAIENCYADDAVLIAENENFVQILRQVHNLDEKCLEKPYWVHKEAPTVDIHKMCKPSTKEDSKNGPSLSVEWIRSEGQRQMTNWKPKCNHKDKLKQIKRRKRMRAAWTDQQEGMVNLSTNCQFWISLFEIHLQAEFSFNPCQLWTE